ncbi:electron transfer protein 1 [Vararia minispora EC-137]|uniref:Electron transfer protein 1 n=1 Tax=Vararia minispora EC-137 TaxID=1314806 RepID=A0ACB8QD75_9AGAM|nr:electron transfer protein 1 [Vararia minispora EC-137]
MDASAEVRAHPESSSTNASPSNPPLSGPPVGAWLLLCSTLVFAVIVVGGVTRLTESGLSITEWKPVTGVIPPLSHADWEEEFAKYKATPEYKMLNAHMTVDDFKDIYYMEWGHRVLGRVIGGAFVIPLAYFALRKRLSPGLPARLAGFAFLLGGQGALGWYMVKSGLEDEILTTPGAIPRVSQYRLAAHLGAALVLYAGMFYSGISIMKDGKFAHKGTWAGLRDAGNTWMQTSKALRAFRRHSALLTALVFLTAFSGAFVAGLDAGLLYNEFPMMGGRLHPPADELVAPAYSGTDGKERWRNIFENPTTVQFDHRVLGVATYTAAALVFALTFLRRRALPPAAMRAAAVTFGVANVQVALGISTLLYLVPVPLAAAHQAGSVMLLTAALHMILAVRRPGAASQAWRKASYSLLYS